MRERSRSEEASSIGTALEVVAAFVDAVSLPGAGAVVKHFGRRAGEELRRARSVALAAAETSSGMRREDLAEAIADDARLIPLVTRLLHAAGENGYDDTLKAMGRAFGEAVRDREKVDDAHLVLAALADLGERHARVLRVMGGDPPIHGTLRQWTSHDVEAASHLPLRTTALCIASLVARGLVESAAPFPGGGTMFSITHLGRDVLGVLEEYTAEADPED